MTAGPLPPSQPHPDLLRLVARQLFEEISQEHRRGLGFAALRRVEISAIDPATQTATVILGGDLENPIPGVKTMPAYVPRVGDVPWAWQNGSDLLLAGGPGLDLPKVKVRKGGTSGTTDGNFNDPVDFGAGALVYYDRYGMFNTGQSTRITFPWPGKYQIRYQALWDEGASGRRIAEILDQDGNVRASSRNPATATAADDVTTNPETEHVFAAGNWVTVRIFQSGVGALNVADHPFSNVISAHYLP
jgi:hypothetical protein